MKSTDRIRLFIRHALIVLAMVGTMDAYAESNQKKFDNHYDLLKQAQADKALEPIIPQLLKVLASDLERPRVTIPDDFWKTVLKLGTLRHWEFERAVAARIPDSMADWSPSLRRYAPRLVLYSYEDVKRKIQNGVREERKFPRAFVSRVQAEIAKAPQSKDSPSPLSQAHEALDRGLNERTDWPAQYIENLINDKKVDPSIWAGLANQQASFTKKVWELAAKHVAEGHFDAVYAGVEGREWPASFTKKVAEKARFFSDEKLAQVIKKAAPGSVSELIKLAGSRLGSMRYGDLRVILEAAARHKAHLPDSFVIAVANLIPSEEGMRYSIRMGIWFWGQLSEQELPREVWRMMEAMLLSKSHMRDMAEVLAAREWPASFWRRVPDLLNGPLKNSIVKGLKQQQRDFPRPVYETLLEFMKHDTLRGNAIAVLSTRDSLPKWVEKELTAEIAAGGNREHNAKRILTAIERRAATAACRKARSNLVRNKK